ncbi:hypothetical protein PHISCL_04991 [Aspergillus sclerotialis]|uniref:Uncharacterized protein n=1 Tax=Aspergillus sclerotialis TaxID=2070753 RepID=A0A3A2ZHJ3_9EURO|nr:hypothetical protein PHISCL_04991 [Aspergillus sclerotialis]
MEHELLAPPPPYSDHDADQPPQYEATVKFPAQLNGYFQWRFTTTFHLGPSGDEKLYAVSTQASLFKSKQSLTLHDGPTEKSPVMAKVESTRYVNDKPFTISIPSRSGSESIPITTRVENLHPSAKRTIYSFSFPVPARSSNRHRLHYHYHNTTSNTNPPTDTKHPIPTSAPSPLPSAESTPSTQNLTRLETFEWRRSYGKEIQDLAPNSFGWKLVRLSRRVRGHSTSRSGRPRGNTSDGKEVVAVIAHNSSWSMTKGFKFAFLGTGLSGRLGGDWEVMVVMSALQLWNMDYQDQALVAGAST